MVFVLFRTTIVPCRSMQRKSQVLLSTLQKLKEDSSPYAQNCYLFDNFRSIRVNM